MASNSAAAPAPSARRAAHAERDAQRGGHADRRRAADRHVADRGRHLAVVAAAEVDLLRGQAPLVDHHHGAVLPRHRRDHRASKRHTRAPGAPAGAGRGMTEVGEP